MSYRNYSVANGFHVDPSGNGDFKTITAALAAATAPQTIYLAPRVSYTENLTLKAGIDITCLDGDANVPNVKIIGKLSASFSGACSISNIYLQTNGDNILSLTGANATVVNLNNCYLNCSNATGISSTGSNSSASVQLNNTSGNIGTTGISIFAVSNGSIGINYGGFTNTGNSTTAASLTSAAILQSLYAILNFPISAASTAAVSLFNTDMDTSGVNTACLALTTSSNCFVLKSRLASGTATPLTNTASTVNFHQSSLNSSNATAVSTSGGLFAYSDLSQEATLGLITGGGNVTGKGTQGRISGSASPVGFIGEVISSNIAVGSHVSLSNGVATTITSISVTPGTWMIFGSLIFTGATTSTNFFSSINTTTNNIGTAATNYNVSLTNAGGNDMGGLTPMVVASPTVATNYFLVAQCGFSAGTVFGYGQIQAVRVA